MCACGTPSPDAYWTPDARSGDGRYGPARVILTTPRCLQEAYAVHSEGPNSTVSPKPIGNQPSTKAKSIAFAILSCLLSCLLVVKAVSTVAKFLKPSDRSRPSVTRLQADNNWLNMVERQSAAKRRSSEPEGQLLNDHLSRRLFAMKARLQNSRPTEGEEVLLRDMLRRIDALLLHLDVSTDQGNRQTALPSPPEK